MEKIILDRLNTRMDNCSPGTYDTHNCWFASLFVSHEPLGDIGHFTNFMKVGFADSLFDLAAKTAVHTHSQWCGRADVQFH